VGNSREAVAYEAEDGYVVGPTEPRGAFD